MEGEVRGECMAMMIAGGKEHTQSVLQGPDTLQRETIWQRMQQNNASQNNAEDSVIGKAAEVQISKEGRKMCMRRLMIL